MHRRAADMARDQIIALCATEDLGKISDELIRELAENLSETRKLDNGMRRRKTDSSASH